MGTRANRIEKKRNRQKRARAAAQEAAVVAGVASNDAQTPQPQSWMQWASSSLFAAVKTTQDSVSGLSQEARVTALKSVLYPLMAQMVSATLTFDGDSDLCGFLNSDCHDAHARNATGSERVDFLRDLDKPVFGREPSEGARSLLRDCLDIDGDRIEALVSQLVESYGFGAKSCSVETTFNRWIVEFLIKGLGPQVDCDQVDAMWSQTVEECNSISAYLALAAKIGIGVGVVLGLIVAGAAIYYLSKHVQQFSREHRASGSRTTDVPRTTEIELDNVTTGFSHA